MASFDITGGGNSATANSRTYNSQAAPVNWNRCYLFVAAKPVYSTGYPTCTVAFGGSTAVTALQEGRVDNSASESLWCWSMARESYDLYGGTTNLQWTISHSGTSSRHAWASVFVTGVATGGAADSLTFSDDGVPVASYAMPGSHGPSRIGLKAFAITPTPQSTNQILIDGGTKLGEYCSDNATGSNNVAIAIAYDESGSNIGAEFRSSLPAGALTNKEYATIALSMNYRISRLAYTWILE